jgi:hypothetical protein
MLGPLVLEIDTLPEEDSAAPADDKYLNFLAHTSVADLAAPGTLPYGGGVGCIHLDTRLKEYLMLPGLSCGIREDLMVLSLRSGMSIESELMPRPQPIHTNRGR